MPKFTGTLRNKVPLPLKRAARFVRRAVKAAFGKDHLMQCDVSIPKRRYGNDWADWVIARDFLNEKSIVYSFGLGKDVSFEHELISDVGCKVYGFDPTPISLEYVKFLDAIANFFVYPYGLSTVDGEKSFGNPTEGDWSFSTRDETRGTVRLPVRSCSSLMSELHNDHIDLLKMDIEGEEYGVIDDMLKHRILPGQLLVEFHHAWNIAELSDTRACVRKLKDAGYKIFDISAAGREFSFIHASLLG